MQPIGRSDIRRTTLAVPDCGAVGMPLRLSLWLVPQGGAVTAGDPVAELVVGGATIDLEAPLTGRLVRQLADEDDQVTVGSPIAEFEAVA